MNISESLTDLNSFLSSTSNEEEVELKTQLLAFSFLSEIEKLYTENNIKRNELAKAIGVSPSHLTQLFRGHRIPNLKILTKMIMYFGREYKIATEDKNALTKTNQEEEPKVQYEPAKLRKKNRKVAKLQRPAEPKQGAKIVYIPTCKSTNIQNAEKESKKASCL